MHLLCVLLDSTLADDHFARTTYVCSLVNMPCLWNVCECSPITCLHPGIYVTFNSCCQMLRTQQCCRCGFSASLPSASCQS